MIFAVFRARSPNSVDVYSLSSLISLNLLLKDFFSQRELSLLLHVLK
ncbi:hypothetical protein [Cyanobacterium aponinum]|uniref:Uncharacterized protein n=2 Tax=Cyanobacterium TaxID=102234 RepID=A0AAF0ZD29_9CHRO|nr:hypothetical protein [Cyanobacterium aponinum]WPF90141.1 hypothetical protein SAY89_07685 [Cyanobacterium aponinum AL20115]